MGFMYENYIEFGFFSISAFTCFKQIEEKRTEKLIHYK